MMNKLFLAKYFQTKIALSFMLSLLLGCGNLSNKSNIKKEEVAKKSVNDHPKVYFGCMVEKNLCLRFAEPEDQKGCPWMLEGGVPITGTKVKDCPTENLFTVCGDPNQEIDYWIYSENSKAISANEAECLPPLHSSSLGPSE